MEGIPTRKQSETVFTPKKSERRKAFSDVSETVKAFLRAGLISALLAYNSSNEALGQQGQKGTAENPEKNNRGAISASISQGTPSIENSKESLPINAETIKGYVFSDNYERFFLSQKGSDSYFTPDNVKDGFDHGSVPIATLEKFCDEQKTKDIIFVHTHPLAIYSGVGYSGKETSEMQSGELKPSPMPPSTVDFQGVAAIFSSLEKKGIKMNGKIFDATGVWEYRVNNENIEKFNKYKELIEIFPKISSEAITHLSKEEKEAFLKMGDVHQDKIIQTLKANPETAALGNKLEELFLVEFEKIGNKYDDIVESLEGLNNISFFITNYNRFHKNSHPAPGAALSDLIANYKTEAAKLGFVVEYTPYQK